MSLSTESVWELLSGNLRGYISRRVRDSHDVDDILQTVFLRIHKGISRLRDSEQLDAWIYRIARNAVIDFYRGRTESVSLDTVSEPVAEEEEEPSGAVACVKPMIEALPEKYREALANTELNGLTQREYAQMAGLSFSGAKSRVQRGRGLLKEMLLECCRFEFDRRGGIADFEPKQGTCACCDLAVGDSRRG